MGDLAESLSLLLFTVEISPPLPPFLFIKINITDKMNYSVNLVNQCWDTVNSTAGHIN